MKKRFFLCLFLLVGMGLVFGKEKVRPANPEASPEVRALLAFFYEISGKYVLSGQHNYPNTHSTNSRFAARYIGKRPVIWSSDMGFAEAGGKDSYYARPDIVEEAIRQHKQGAIITLCWHAVPPTADEPVTFQPLPGANPDSLLSVQGRLTDRQFQEILTPGTRLHARWCAQVDTVAFYLKKLRDAHVPVLWRPYHEMNGSWFWWGGRPNAPSTRRLYQQLFDRYVHYHKLYNLIWVWNVDRFHNPAMYFSHYYPGDEYLDILSLDVYGNDFNQFYYDSLVVLSKGKPLVLGEVGNPPSGEILREQPLWSYYVIWAGMVRNLSKKEYDKFIHTSQVLFLNDPMYWKLSAPYRTSCGLPALPLFSLPVDFTGNWMLCEEESTFDRFGPVNIPYRLAVNQEWEEMIVQKHFIQEWEMDQIAEELFFLEGREVESEYMGMPQMRKAKWSEKDNALWIESKLQIKRGGETQEMKTEEIWRLNKKRKILSIDYSATTFWGERKLRLVYKRE